MINQDRGSIIHEPIRMLLPQEQRNLQKQLLNIGMVFFALP